MSAAKCISVEYKYILLICLPGWVGASLVGVCLSVCLLHRTNKEHTLMSQLEKELRCPKIEEYVGGKGKNI
jgi:hypothetical protein